MFKVRSTFLFRSNIWVNPVFSCTQGNQEKQSRLVRQFHFHGWPEIGIPAEGKGMIDLIAAVQKQQQQTGNHPITVHCR